MNVRIRSATLALALLACPAALADGGDTVVPGQVVVRLGAGVDPDAFAASYSAPGAPVVVIDRITTRRTYLLRVPDGDEEEFADLVRTDPRVARVEPNYTGRTVSPDPGTQSIFVAGTAQAYANQPFTLLLGLSDAHRRSVGAGVLVAVIDTGVDPQHPVLAARLAPGARNFLLGADPLDVRDVGDCCDTDGDGRNNEDVGHGTAAAGLVHRVAPGASLLILKAMDSDGMTTTWTMVDAMYYAFDAGARVVNLSMGTTVPTFVIDEAVAEAAARGVTVVAAVGNDATSSPVRYPAGRSAQGVVAVGATTDADLLAPFSNYGSHVTLCAPGVDITSTIPGGAYGVTSGSSLSAPIVAGCVAVLRALPRAGDPLIALRGTARRLDVLNPGYQGMLGAGRVQLDAALQATFSGESAGAARPSAVRRWR